MKVNRKDAFRKVIKLAEADKPTVDFTDSIMQTIEADAVREAALKALLQQPDTEGPAFNFTANVMAHITANDQQHIFKPIISRKAWYGVATMLLVFLMMIGLSNPAKTPVNDQSCVADLLKLVNGLPPVYLLAVIITSALLFIDYLINQRIGKTETP